MTTKKMTIRYWNSLSRESRTRALHHVFPNMKCTVKMLLDEQPDLNNGLWKQVWASVRIPCHESYYKTVVHKNTYLP